MINVAHVDFRFDCGEVMVTLPVHTTMQLSACCPCLRIMPRFLTDSNILLCRF
jgi:hypothetical protein